MSNATVPILDALAEKEMSAAGVCRKLAALAKARGRFEQAIAHETAANEHERKAVEVAQCSAAYRPNWRGTLLVSKDEVTRVNLLSGEVDRPVTIGSGLEPGEAERAERAIRRDGVVHLEAGRVVRRLSDRAKSRIAGALLIAAVLLAAAFGSGCGPAAVHAESEQSAGRLGDRSVTRDVVVIHDSTRRVTCYVYIAVGRGGISCLPDSALAPHAPERAER